MARQTPYEVPQRPQALQSSPLGGLVYWGDRKPPKDFTQVFNAAKSEESSGDAKTRQVATLRLYGPIYDGWYGVSARKVSEALDGLGEVDEIRVRINSPGGDAWEGMAILNMLRAHAAEVVAVVDGIAASAASCLAAGCDRTVMSPGTQMMIHDASAFAFGPAETMEKARKFLDSVSNSIASIYADVAGGSDDEWRALMREETWYTAKEAVESGLADTVGIVKDSGETETAEDVEPPDLDSEVEDAWDLSVFNHAGRSHAPAPKPLAASASGSAQQEGSDMPFINDVRTRLGVAEDADEATVLAALDEALEERAETDETGGTTPEIPEGMSLVDTETLATLRAGAEDGRAARLEQRTQARDAAVQAAIKAGKIPANRRKHYQDLWDADADGTRELLDKLEPGLVPLSELGHDNPVDENKSEEDAVYAAVWPDDEKIGA